MHDKKGGSRGGRRGEGGVEERDGKEKESAEVI
jgi:hypothetical protein